MNKISAEFIVELGKKQFQDVEGHTVHFLDDERANALLNDIEENPHAFVLAALMDRQIKAEKAWGIPQKIFDILGTHNLADLAKESLSTYQDVFRENTLHRFNSDMAGVFYDAVRRIQEKYVGNASKIWADKPSSALVVYRFLEFNGCGVKIATMAANILARQYKIEFSDYFSIDISPDVHVMRVMKRLGYVPEQATREMVIYKARELHPEFPGIIDSSCWEIGKNWCHPRNPDCGNCVVKNCAREL
jgi:endonuclease III